MAEACDRIFRLTGLRRSPSQVRKFLKDMGLKFQRIPDHGRPTQKNLAEHVQTQTASCRAGAEDRAWTPR